MTNVIETDKAILPINSILAALNITKEQLLSCNVKPEIINSKMYYSLDDLEKIKKYIMKGNCNEI